MQISHNPFLKHWNTLHLLTGGDTHHYTNEDGGLSPFIEIFSNFSSCALYLLLFRYIALLLLNALQSILLL